MKYVLDYDLHAAVLEFHTTFGLAVNSFAVFNEQLVNLRNDLLLEEAIEYETALADNDLTLIADSLADTLYVLHGSSHSYGVSFTDPTNTQESSLMELVGDHVTLTSSFMQRDPVTQAQLVGDSLGDIRHKILELAWFHQLPFAQICMEVHRSNMSKLTQDKKVIRYPNGKVGKSDLFSPPDIAGILTFNGLL